MCALEFCIYLHDVLRKAQPRALAHSKEMRLVRVWFLAFGPPGAKSNVGALVTRIEFRGILYNSYHKEPPKTLFQLFFVPTLLRCLAVRGRKGILAGPAWECKTEHWDLLARGAVRPRRLTVTYSTAQTPCSKTQS